MTRSEFDAHCALRAGKRWAPFNAPKLYVPRKLSYKPGLSHSIQRDARIALVLVALILCVLGAL